VSHLKKLDDRVRKMIFFDYKSGSKAYHAYDPFTNVVFDEQAQWDWDIDGDDGEPGSGDNVFTVEYTTKDQMTLVAEKVDETSAE
jgi:hypothetical protein